MRYGRIQERYMASVEIPEAGMNLFVDAIDGKLKARDKYGIYRVFSGEIVDFLELQCTEDLDQGDYVNIYNDGGISKIQKAFAKSGDIKKADGYVKSNYVNGALVKIYFEGVNDKLTGLDNGESYYLSDVIEGQIIDIPPVTNGAIVQHLGIAASETELSTELSQPVKIN